MMKMRMVQTFWSGKRSLMHEGFGWRHPEYHLMAWALSCLKLNEQGFPIVLYTDSEGYDVLIKKMHLPYTEAIVKYDDLPCQACQWAYAKVETYSIQKEPFIHVDSDVFLSQPLSESILESGLVAQNKESGTAYYREMAERLLQRKAKISDYLEEGLQKESIPSYNMGIFGGCDLDFIHDYCKEIFRFFGDNKMDDAEGPISNVACNVVFEQMFFAILAESKHRRVTCVLKHTMPDNGYTREEFCDLQHDGKKAVFHIIGGHKQNATICDLIGKILIRDYPDYFEKILSLFPSCNLRLEKSKASLFTDVSIQKCMAQYEDFLLNAERKWRNLSNDRLFELEKKVSRCLNFLNATEEEQKRMCIKKHPYLWIFTIPKTWLPGATELLGSRLQMSGLKKISDVVIIPTLMGRGLKEISIDDLGFNIVELSGEQIAYEKLYASLVPCFNGKLQNNTEEIRKCVNKEMAYLLYQGAVLATT